MRAASSIHPLTPYEPMPGTLTIHQNTWETVLIRLVDARASGNAEGHAELSGFVLAQLAVVSGHAETLRDLATRTLATIRQKGVAGIEGIALTILDFQRTLDRTRYEQNLADFQSALGARPLPAADARFGIHLLGATGTLGQFGLTSLVDGLRSNLLGSDVMTSLRNGTPLQNAVSSMLDRAVPGINTPRVEGMGGRSSDVSQLRPAHANAGYGLKDWLGDSTGGFLPLSEKGTGKALCQWGFTTGGGLISYGLGAGLTGPLAVAVGPVGTALFTGAGTFICGVAFEEKKPAETKPAETKPAEPKPAGSGQTPSGQQSAKPSSGTTQPAGTGQTNSGSTQPGSSTNKDEKKDEKKDAQDKAGVTGSGDTTTSCGVPDGPGSEVGSGRNQRITSAVKRTGHASFPQEQGTGTGTSQTMTFNVSRLTQTGRPSPTNDPAMGRGVVLDRKIADQIRGPVINPVRENTGTGNQNAPFDPKRPPRS